MKCESCIHSGMCKMEIALNWDRENCPWSKPTADFIPESEVERLTIELKAMRTAANSYKMHYENAMSEVERLKRILNSYALQYGTVTDKQKVIDTAKADGAREIIEYLEGNGLLNMTPQGIAELKKKYKGESQ